MSDRELLTEKKHSTLFKLNEKYRTTGNIKLGLNETIKAIRNGSAACVILANDSIPKCLTDPIAILCEQQGVTYNYVEKKESLGKSMNLKTGNGTIAAAICRNKDEDNSKLLKDYAEFL